MSARGKWPRPSLATRFSVSYSIDPASGCWNWIKKLNPDGYPLIQKNNRWLRAHRLSVVLSGKEIPEGLLVCHRCDNPKCVNPEHLFIGTHADNSRDMANKNRGTIGERNRHAKLRRAQVEEIRNDTVTPSRALAARFGVCERTIYNYRSGRTWSKA